MAGEPGVRVCLAIEDVLQGTVGCDRYASKSESGESGDLESLWERVLA